jgi:hypothetical protein
MVDLAETRALCDRLAARLGGQPDWSELRAVYLEMAPLVGQLQGSVGELSRRHGEGEDIRKASASLEELKQSVRRVGLDIRLASERALLLGLQTALQQARETLDSLERIGG